MGDEERVEFENDAVRVLRVKVGVHAQTHVRNRRDRVLVWLTDSHHVRTESSGKSERMHRKLGDVAWREASAHHIENTHDEGTELIIVELKR